MNSRTDHNFVFDEWGKGRYWWLRAYCVYSGMAQKPEVIKEMEELAKDTNQPYDVICYDKKSETWFSLKHILPNEYGIRKLNNMQGYIDAEKQRIIDGIPF